MIRSKSGRRNSTTRKFFVKQYSRWTDDGRMKLKLIDTDSGTGRDRQVIECESDITKYYWCEHCGKQCTSWHQLKNHFRSHETQTKRQIAKALEEFKCEYCDKLCGDRGVLTRHIEESHLKKTRYTCNDCGKNFYYKYMLVRHIKESHSDTPPTCEICHMVYAKFATLRKHLEEKHNPEHRKLMCEICLTTFSRKDSYKKHMKKHSGDPNTTICSVCGKILCSLSSLKDHMTRRHNEDTPFECEICDKAFTTALSLKTHKLTHGEPSFECHICQKQFIQPASLRIHIKRVHIRLRPHACDICSKYFATRTELKKHRPRCKGPIPETGPKYADQEVAISLGLSEELKIEEYNI